MSHLGGSLGVSPWFGGSLRVAIKVALRVAKRLPRGLSCWVALGVNRGVSQEIVGGLVRVIAWGVSQGDALDSHGG